MSFLINLGDVLEHHVGALTFVIALATVALALFANFQWRETRKTSKRQLRAYLSVQIGNALYQERHTGTKFVAQPVIKNAGQTPAYKVSYEIEAKIIPNALALGYSFAAPRTGQQSQSSIGPQEFRNMAAVVPDFVPDSDVQKIKDGEGQALWVWGVVSYEDAFGDHHTTEFCQRLWWARHTDGSEVIFGAYDPRFGKST
jgi:hypothetical protein